MEEQTISSPLTVQTMIANGYHFKHLECAVVAQMSPRSFNSGVKTKWDTGGLDEKRSPKIRLCIRPLIHVVTSSTSVDSTQCSQPVTRPTRALHFYGDYFGFKHRSTPTTPGHIGT